MRVEGEGELKATSAHRSANGVFVFLGHEPWSMDLVLRLPPSDGGLGRHGLGELAAESDLVQKGTDRGV